MDEWINEWVEGVIHSSHHRLTAEEVGVVLIDEFLHPLLPHLEHLGAPVVQEGQLLQHDVPGGSDLGAQVELRRFRLRIELWPRDRTARRRTCVTDKDKALLKDRHGCRLCVCSLHRNEDYTDDAH